jgi:hypothetical protein
MRLRARSTSHADAGIGCGAVCPPRPAGRRADSGLILGHEAVGVAEEAGPQVRIANARDRVIDAVGVDAQPPTASPPHSNWTMIFMRERDQVAPDNQHVSARIIILKPHTLFGAIRSPPLVPPRRFSGPGVFRC